MINNQLYVVGGFTERDQDAGPTAEAYNVTSNQWRLVSSMKISMELYDSAVLDNKLYVVNSSSENLVGLVYEPTLDEWVYMAHGLNTGNAIMHFVINPLKEDFSNHVIFILSLTIPKIVIWEGLKYEVW